jgi:hypothetical protein
VIFAAMSVRFIGGLATMLAAEYGPNPVPGAAGVAGIMEGKELRHGIANSVLWGAATTAASNGSVNAMHSSPAPLAGGVALLNILLGEVIFGGGGAGLYGMLIFVIRTVFIAGLMVGRTPEYLGKKLEAREIKLAMIAVLLPSACILLFAALALGPIVEHFLMSAGRTFKFTARNAMQSQPLLERTILRRALIDALRKLDPRQQSKNPVVFVVEHGFYSQRVCLARRRTGVDGHRRRSGGASRRTGQNVESSQRCKITRSTGFCGVRG